MKALCRCRNCVLALLMGFAMPLLIWVGAGVAFYQRRKLALADNLVCSIDADCPAGFVCVNGQCFRGR